MCSTAKIAAGRSPGSPRSSARSGSRPPAEAPTTTMARRWGMRQPYPPAARLHLARRVGAELRLEQVHRLEEGGLLAGRELVKNAGQRAGGAVQPLPDDRRLGRVDLDQRPAAV